MKWTISERCISLARQLVEEDRVVDIQPYPLEQKWEADVIDDKVYRVILDGTAREQDKCQCDYYRAHSYCPHTVAVELALSQREIDRLMQPGIDYESLFKRPRLAKTFLDRFQQTTIEQVNSLYLQPYLIADSGEGRFFLELRIGKTGKAEHLYVVRHILDFMHLYEQQGEYQINQKKVFTLSESAFSQADHEFLQLLFLLRDETESLVGRTLLPSKMGRKMEVTHSSVEKIIDWMQRYQRVAIKVDEDERKTLEFSTDLPIVAYLGAEPLVLMIKAEIKQFFPLYHWLYHEGTLYDLTVDQQNVIEQLRSLMPTNQVQLDYHMDELPQVCRHVVPALEQVTTVVQDPQIQQLLVQAPLQPEFYFKSLPSKILLRVDYHYGEVIFSSDPTAAFNPRQLPVLRDEKAEAQIEKLLSEYHYQSVGRNYLRDLPTGAELYQFFTTEMEAFEELGVVHLDDRLSGMFIDGDNPLQIQVDEQSNWLDIRFDLSGIQQSEVNQVLQRLEERQPFYELESGQILNLDTESFQETSAILKELRSELNQDEMQVPKYRAMQVKELLEEKSDVTFADYFTLMAEHLAHPEHYEVTVPADLQAELREYQFKGFQWMKMLSHYGLSGILADDMGLGKTLQTITYLLSEKEEGRLEQPALIIAPASLTYNWQSEIKKFAPTLSSLVVSGLKEEREKMIRSSASHDVLMTSYSSFRQDVSLYQEQSFAILILDEAQMVKNAATKTFSALKEIEIQQRFALSGTPIENNLDELWSLFQMLMPGFFPSLRVFHQMDVTEISKMIRPFVLRRDKAMVLDDLPDKMEMNMYSTLTDEQKKVYLAYLQQMQSAVNAMDHEAFKRNRISILAGLTRLRQICCTPALFMDDYDEISGKEQQVHDLLQQAKENKRRVLIFSQFTSMLSRLHQQLEEMGISAFYLDGTTKPEKRMEMVEAFNAGECEAFLISLKAGGTGLNLTGADTVILFDLWWNPAVEEQAAGRAHRIGQKNVVEVWRLIAEGTIEEKMYQLQQEKRELFDKIMNADETGQASQLTEEDIRAILNYGE